MSFDDIIREREGLSPLELENCRLRAENDRAEGLVAAAGVLNGQLKDQLQAKDAELVEALAAIDRLRVERDEAREDRHRVGAALAESDGQNLALRALITRYREIITKHHEGGASFIGTPDAEIRQALQAQPTPQASKEGGGYIDTEKGITFRSRKGRRCVDCHFVGLVHGMGPQCARWTTMVPLIATCPEFREAQTEPCPECGGEETIIKPGSTLEFNADMGIMMTVRIPCPACQPEREEK